jgi:hypothetical protein
MTKKVALWISVALLFMASGCSNAQQVRLVPTGLSDGFVKSAVEYLDMVSDYPLHTTGFKMQLATQNLEMAARRLGGSIEQDAVTNDLKEWAGGHFQRESSAVAEEKLSDKSFQDSHAKDERCIVKWRKSLEERSKVKPTSCDLK